MRLTNYFHLTNQTDRSGQSGKSMEPMSPIMPDRSLRRLSVAVLSTLTLGLGSCATNPPAQQAESTPSATSKPSLQVVTTFLPMTQFTTAVAGDRAKVTQLLPTNVGPHDYQSKPEDVQKLVKADVLVQNGLGMEEFLGSLVKNAGNTKLKTIDSSQGIKTIASEEVEGHQHKHDGEKAAGEHDHGEVNPHIWLDPKRVIQQVETIRDGLIQADPEGKEVYTANAAAYVQKLRDLDAETAKLLQPYTGKTFVAFHDFAPYFAQSYNLKANFLVDVPEEKPSPADVKRVINTVKATNLKTLLTEPQSGEDAFAAISQDLSVRVSTFDPMETGGTEALQPDYYITTMQKNVKTLVSAFTGKSPQSFLPLSMPQPVAVGFSRVAAKL